MTTKVCSRCSAEKSLDEFHYCANGLNERQGQCRACESARDRHEERRRSIIKRAHIAGASEIHCSRCGRNLPLADFGVDAKRPSGRKGWCRECCRKHANERNTLPHRKEQRRIAGKKWRAEHPGYGSHRMKLFKERDPEGYSAQIRKGNLRRKYGMTPEEFDAKFKETGGKCPLCGRECSKDPKSSKETMVVDHSHTSGKVRGLICQPCNFALGALLDSPDALRNAALYLERHTS